MSAEKKKLLTPKFRVNYQALYTPEEQEREGAKPRYQIKMIFDKEAQATPGFKAIVALAKEVEKDQFPKGRPKGAFFGLLKEGEDNQNKEGNWYGGCDEDSICINAWTHTKILPSKKVDGEFIDLTEDSGEFYDGCYARTYIQPWAYDNKSRGVNAFLGAVLKVADGEKLLGGATSASKTFADDDIEEMDDSDFEDGDTDF